MTSTTLTDEHHHVLNLSQVWADDAGYLPSSPSADKAYGLEFHRICTHRENRTRISLRPIYFAEVTQAPTVDPRGLKYLLRSLSVVGTKRSFRSTRTLGYEQRL